MQVFQDGRALPLREADILAAICEPKSRHREILDISQPYTLPRPVAEIALFVYIVTCLVECRRC
jgi:hypothetical protein